MEGSRQDGPQNIFLVPTRYIARSGPGSPDLYGPGGILMRGYSALEPLEQKGYTTPSGLAYRWGNLPLRNFARRLVTMKEKW